MSWTRSLLAYSSSFLLIVVDRLANYGVAHLWLLGILHLLGILAGLGEGLLSIGLLQLCVGLLHLHLLSVVVRVVADSEALDGRDVVLVLVNCDSGVLVLGMVFLVLATYSRSNVAGDAAAKALCAAENALNKGEYRNQGSLILVSVAVAFELQVTFILARRDVPGASDTKATVTAGGGNSNGCTVAAAGQKEVTDAAAVSWVEVERTEGHNDEV